MKRKRIALLIAGTGTIAQSVMDAARLGRLHAEMAVVVSHERWGYGLLRAEREGIPAELHDLAEYRIQGKSERAYQDDLAALLSRYRPDIVIATDWRLPLGDSLEERFAGRLLRVAVTLPGVPNQFDPYGRSAISIIHEAFGAGTTREAVVSVTRLGSRIAPDQTLLQERLPIDPLDTLADIELRANRAQQELLVQALERIIAPHPVHG